MGLLGNLLLLWKNRKTITAASKTVDLIREGSVKDGKSTTEFKGKVVVQILTVLATLKPELGIEPEKGLLIVSGLEAAYMFVRMVVKAFSKKKDEPAVVAVAALPPSA